MPLRKMLGFARCSELVAPRDFSRHLSEDMPPLRGAPDPRIFYAKAHPSDPKAAHAGASAPRLSVFAATHNANGLRLTSGLRRIQ